MINCFPTNNIKTTKDYIEHLHSNNLYCHYANDIWKNNGEMRQKFISSNSFKIDIDKVNLCKTSFV